MYSDIKDTQSEIIKLISEKREKSKERIVNKLKDLEAKIESFSKITDNHAQFIKQIAYLQR